MIIFKRITFYVALLLLAILILPEKKLLAQTTGLIYKQASNGGRKVLDPNGDGYTSPTTAGFPGVNMDEGSSNSEIAYKVFPAFMLEPLADVSTGNRGGHTDFVGSTGSPLSMHFDGTNLLFRIRLGGQSTASKGYSILIDTNNDLNGTGKNPGFEFEILLANNFDVRIYDHRTNTTGGDVIFNGSADQYSQKSIASSKGGGNPDYFYDFYVPLAAFNIANLANTTLRMTGATVAGAVSSLFGVVHDVAGIDDKKFGGNVIQALKITTMSFPPTTLNSILTNDFAQAVAIAPHVTGPLVMSSTVVRGYSIEETGSVIRVFWGSAPIGTTTVQANGTWTLTTSALMTGDVISATVKPANKTISASSNEVTVRVSCGETNCNTGVSVIPLISGSYCGNTTTISGIHTGSPGSTIKVYDGLNEIGSTTVNAFGTWTATIVNSSPGKVLTAKAKAPDKSESGNSAPITIDAAYNTTGEGSVKGTAQGLTTIYEAGTSVSGDAPDGAWVTLYINGEPYVDVNGNTIIVQALGGKWAITGISPFELYAGASLSIKLKSTQTSKCESSSSSEAIVACVPASTSAIRATFTEIKYCPSKPAIIKLSTTEAGIIYSIYRKVSDNSYVEFGSSVLGMGNPVELSSLPVTESNTVLQVKTLKIGASCQYSVGQEMTAESYPETPNNFTLISSTSTLSCANAEVTLTLKAAEVGYSYQLINNDTKEKVGTLVTPTQTGDIVFDKVQINKTTTFGVVIKRLNTACEAPNSITKAVTVAVSGPDVTKSVTMVKAKICINTSNTISVQTQGILYTYKVYDAGNPNTALATFQGTTGTVNTTLSSSNFNVLGTKTFYVTVSGNGCSDLKMTSLAQVEVVSGFGETVSAGSSQTICGKNFTTLNGSDPIPGSGVWTIKSKPFGSNPNFGGSQSSTTRNAQVDDLTISGDYIFTWTVTSCNSASESSDVKITVNCPAEFSVKATKFVNEYQNNDVLVTMTDSDGDITSAQVISGRVPPGTSMNTTSGQLTVADQTKLMPGNYYYTTRTTDNKGVDTDTPIAMRMYSMGSAPTPLPVDLTYFVAAYANRRVILQWTTAAENDNDCFIVERSTDCKEFNQIGVVKGSGTTRQSTRYTYTDKNPLTGTVYYRLKQVDLDKTFKYTSIISLAVKQDAAIQAYPNPFLKELNISMVTEAPGAVTVLIQNTNGKTVYSDTHILEKGFQEITLPLAGLSKGVYLLRVTGIGISKTIKVVKTH